MDNTVYIDLDTFDIVNTLDNSIHCDRDIALVIVELLKKGYKTNASCAGHNRSGSLIKTFEAIENYEDWIETYGDYPLLKYVEMYDDEHFVHVEEESSTYVYIAFAEDYEFENIPEGFKISKFENGISIGKHILYFVNDDFQKRRKQIDIDKEILEARQKLLEWAKNLKPVNEKGMKL